MHVYRRFSGATRLESQIGALIYELRLNRAVTALPDVPNKALLESAAQSVHNSYLVGAKLDALHADVHGLAHKVDICSEKLDILLHERKSLEKTNLLISKEIDRLDGYLNFHVDELKSEMRELAESSSLILASVSSMRGDKAVGSTTGIPNRSPEVTVEPVAIAILNEPRIGFDAIHLTSRKLGVK